MLARRLVRMGLVLASIGAVAACEENETATTPEVVRPVRAIKVADPTSLENRTFPGRARASVEVNLAFEVTGRLVEFPIDVGDKVAEGQVLARLDPRDFQNALQAAEAEGARAEAQRDRVAQAAATGAVSQQDLTDAEAALRVAEAEARIRAKALEDSVIAAPYAGTIAAKYVDNFQNVSAKQAIARILDTTRIEMVVNIPESLISVVPYIDDAWVRFDAFPDRVVPARVSEIGTEASETTRTYPVTVIMDQPEDFTILPGMAGRAGGSGDLPGDRGLAAVHVPVSAVFTDGKEGESFVWVIDEQAGTVHRREVRTGALTNVGIRVEDGLEPGEWIATAGVHYLREGQKVSILEPQAEG